MPLLASLRSGRVMPPAIVPTPAGSVEGLLSSYRLHLVPEPPLLPEFAKAYADSVHPFREGFVGPAGLNLARLDGAVLSRSWSRAASDSAAHAAAGAGWAAPGFFAAGQEPAAQKEELKATRRAGIRSVASRLPSVIRTAKRPARSASSLGRPGSRPATAGAPCR